MALLAPEWDEPFRHLAGQLFLYAGDNAQAYELCRETQLRDVVMHGSEGARIGQLMQERGDFDGRLLHDPEHYLRFRGQASQLSLTDQMPFDLDGQRRLGVEAYISPSLMPRANSIRELERVFENGSRFVALANRRDADHPAFVTLVLSPHWVKRIDEVVGVVERFGLPVALIFAGSHDPLASVETVIALSRLIAAAPAVMMMRCDLAGLGGMALGALASALGASSTVRHLFMGRGKSGTRRRTHVFVPALSNWFDAEMIDYIDGADEFFACFCTVCGGEDVRRFSDQRNQPFEPVHAHFAVRRLAGSVLSGSPDAWLPAWRAHCERSFTSFRLLHEKTGVVLDPPTFLQAWISASIAV